MIAPAEAESPPRPNARLRALRAPGRALVLALLAALLMAPPAPGQGTGPSFVVEDPREGLVREFDIDLLATLPQTDYVTATVWTDAVNHYTGVLLRDILRHAGIDPAAGPGTVTVTALDGYSASLPFAEIDVVAPMLAFLRNGAPMPLRAQGPFWLLFPYDDDPAFHTETTYARSVWQVSRILVER